MWYFFIKSRLDLTCGCPPVAADQVWLGSALRTQTLTWWHAPPETQPGHRDPGQGSRDAARTSRPEWSEWASSAFQHGPGARLRAGSQSSQNCGGNFRFSPCSESRVWILGWWQSRTAGDRISSDPGLEHCPGLGSGMRHPLVFRRN